MPKRGGLGRGLDALIPDKRTETNESAKNERQNSKKDTSDTAKPTRKKSEKATKSVKKTSPGKEKDGVTAVKTQPKKTSDSKELIQSGDEKDKIVTDGIEQKYLEGEVIRLNISQVEPNRDQPRKYFDDEAIEELADSIRQFGIIQPLLVQKMDDYYQIIAGERRWRAAQKCGIDEVPVIVRSFSSQEAVEVALIENIQREDLNPIEEAKAYQRLVSEYHLSQEEVAGRVSKSRSAVTNSMRLLKLAEELQLMVETGAISEGHARAILAAPSTEEQKKVADRVISEKLSVRQTEKLVKDLNNPPSGTQKIEKKDELMETLSENLKNVLDAKVSIRKSSRRRGKIEIEYRSEEDFDRIYALLRSIGQ